MILEFRKIRFYTSMLQQQRNKLKQQKERLFRNSVMKNENCPMYTFRKPWKKLKSKPL